MEQHHLSITLDALGALSTATFQRNKGKGSLQIVPDHACSWDMCTRPPRYIESGTLQVVVEHWKAQMSGSWNTRMPGHLARSTSKKAEIRMKMYSQRTLNTSPYAMKKVNHCRGALVSCQQAREIFRCRALESCQRALICLQAIRDVRTKL